MSGLRSAIPVSRLLLPAVLLGALMGCRTRKPPEAAPGPASVERPRRLLCHLLSYPGQSWMRCEDAQLSRLDGVSVEGLGRKSWISGGHADCFDNGRWVGSAPQRDSGDWESWDVLWRTGDGSLAVDVSLRHDDRVWTTSRTLSVRRDASLALFLPDDNAPRYAWVYSVPEVENAGGAGGSGLTWVALDLAGRCRLAAPAKAWGLARIPRGESISGAFTLPAKDALRTRNPQTGTSDFPRRA